MAVDLNQHLTDLYRGWFDAIGGVGIGSLESVLADEWMYSNYDGAVRDKHDYLAWIDTVSDPAVFVGPYDVSVRRYSDIARVRGGYRVSQPEGGDDLELRFTGVWVLRDDRWQSLVHHTSEVVR